MSLRAGALVWIPCTVLRSPFADERNVWLDSPDGPWSGYVNPGLLRENVSEGQTAVRATVVSSDEREVSARLPGHAMKGRPFRVAARCLQTIDPT
jgi:hypothetical protein